MIEFNWLKHTEKVTAPSLPRVWVVVDHAMPATQQS